jgi:hypothetical protein
MRLNSRLRGSKIGASGTTPREWIQSVTFGSTVQPSRTSALDYPVTRAIFGSTVQPSRTSALNDPVTRPIFGSTVQPSRTSALNDPVTRAIFGSTVQPSRTSALNDPVTRAIFHCPQHRHHIRLLAEGDATIEGMRLQFSQIGGPLEHASHCASVVGSGKEFVRRWSCQFFLFIYLFVCCLGGGG